MFLIYIYKDVITTWKAVVEEYQGFAAWRLNYGTTMRDPHRLHFQYWWIQSFYRWSPRLLLQQSVVVCREVEIRAQISWKSVSEYVEKGYQDRITLAELSSHLLMNQIWFIITDPIRIDIFETWESREESQQVEKTFQMYRRGCHRLVQAAINARTDKLKQLAKK